MKFNEITEPSERQSKVSYVNEIWDSWQDSRLQTLSRITNYLFILNTGALISTLTYVASKYVSNNIQISIWLFVSGIFFSVSHAALDYYLTESSFSAYRRDVEKLYENALEWKSFVNNNENRPPLDWLLHSLGWLGALVFFVGLVIGLCQIFST